MHEQDRVAFFDNVNLLNLEITDFRARRESIHSIGIVPSLAKLCGFTAFVAFRRDGTIWFDNNEIVIKSNSNAK